MVWIIFLQSHSWNHPHPWDSWHFMTQRPNGSRLGSSVFGAIFHRSTAPHGGAAYGAVCSGPRCVNHRARDRNPTWLPGSSPLWLMSGSWTNVFFWQGQLEMLELPSSDMFRLPEATLMNFHVGQWLNAKPILWDNLCPNNLTNPLVEHRTCWQIVAASHWPHHMYVNINTFE